MKTNPITFKVTSLDGNFSYVGTTSYNIPQKASYEVIDHIYSWRRKGFKFYSLDTDPISVIAWSYRSQSHFMSYLALPCHKQTTTQYIYYVVSTLGWSDQTSQFMTIGCLNNSNVTIIPNNDITVPSDPQDSTSVNIIVSAGIPLALFFIHSKHSLFIRLKLIL